MPIRSFWSFAKNINRIRAQEDLRAMEVTLAGQSSEIAERVRSKLTDEMGSIGSAPPEKIDHKAGVAKLANLAERMRPPE